jgi:ABC-type bacteriocin/lantibiotic exporter with double-glycine peptidase domain
LHCVSEYPCNYDRLDLNKIKKLKKKFPKIIIGHSDHFSGILSGPVAYLQGARVFEKHVTLNRGWKGSDHSFALEPEGFRKFVRDINDLIEVFNQRNSTLKKYNKNNIINDSSISSVTLKNLTFDFNKKRKILDNFNYKFFKNNIYAIIGKSGTGKSTLADIISGLTFNFKGVLFFNNNPKITNLFSNIILVEQDSKIFTGTVYENLTLGNNFKPEEVKKILIYLGLDKFANNLYLKLNYRGSNISGGEKQRFAIARALLRKPEVLILDEATNALDNNNFALVIRKLKLSMKNKILIFITHETRINKHVDKIIEFK